VQELELIKRTGKIMIKRVVVAHGVGKQIAKLMDITPEMVSMSLNYKKDSVLARKVRYMAIKDFGGVLIGGKLNQAK
jgi:predicted transcriptional regulator